MVAPSIKRLLNRAALLLVVTGCLHIVGCNDAGRNRVETVTIKGHTFHLEVAADEASITRGLGGRESIPEDGGMLFVFPESSVRSFWMYECLVDIDIIFLDATSHIVAMHEMKAEPPQRDDESELDYRNRLQTYSSGSRARFAIELKSGWLEKLDLELYEKLDLNTDRLKALAQ